MIHVCSLARLHDTVTETGASHIVTLLRLIDRVQRPATIQETNHLILGMDDISNPMDGYTHPAEEHVHDLIDFVQRWDRRAPIVMHCYAGISRSTAGAFISACALNPGRDERTSPRRSAAPRKQPCPTSCWSAMPTASLAAKAAWSRRSRRWAPACRRSKAIPSGSIWNNP